LDGLSAATSIAGGGGKAQLWRTESFRRYTGPRDHLTRLCDPALGQIIGHHFDRHLVARCECGAASSLLLRTVADLLAVVGLLDFDDAVRLALGG
jgi:hypothetical protein